MGPGIELYITSGTDIRGTTKAVITDNKAASAEDIDKWYSIDYTERFFVIALSKLDNTDTAFEIEYQNAAEPNPWFIALPNQYFKTVNAEGERVWDVAVLAGVGGGLVGFFAIVCGGAWYLYSKSKGKSGSIGKV